jgi:coproporphyrinogen III oxidase
VVEEPVTAGTPIAARERAMAAWSEESHDWITAFFEKADGEGRFREDSWERPGGGGGWSRVLTDGDTFEKVGVNRSVVHGALTDDLARRLLLRDDSQGRFFATGVSVVCHPRSPLIPIVHLNVRYFHLSTGDDAPLKAWFGGGIDLTPTYPDPEDARHFHRTLKGMCDEFEAGRYDRFKDQCDRYFVNHHRGGEARGVGGIFFDHLAVDADTTPEESEHRRFTDAVARVVGRAYGPLVDRHRDEPWGEREKNLQLIRRGRYVEFNLVHDRGTRFGLDTGARIESVLMSLPPLAAWPYDPQFEEGSIEDRLVRMLAPRDWAAD